MRDEDNRYIRFIVSVYVGSGISNIIHALCIVSTILLFFLDVTVPMARIDNMAEIVSFKETYETYERARKKGNELENAAIQLDIAECNRWLARKKYWNSLFIFDIYIQDEVDILDPIQ